MRGDGGSIYVARSRVLDARMMLSAEGLPSRGSIGYEIFDEPDALGQTQFQQNINRLRALEGELSRTIGSLDGVASARVHLVLPERQLFARETEQPSASIPRLAHALGARTMVLTAAVGGLVPGMTAGTIVVLRDHLNLMGDAPLRGWRFPDGTPAFVSAHAVYDPRLRDLASESAQELGVRTAIGVYGAMRGPAYETPAEIAMLQTLGATVVGMSMVPEALPAHALGMRVLGLCSLTNAFGEHVSHEEVVRVSNETATTVGRLLVDLFPRLPSEGA